MNKATRNIYAEALYGVHFHLLGKCCIIKQDYIKISKNRTNDEECFQLDKMVKLSSNVGGRFQTVTAPAASPPLTRTLSVTLAVDILAGYHFSSSSTID